MAAPVETLAGRLEAALERMGAYFMDVSPLQRAAADIARRLTDLGIDYAIAGALCLAAHGVVRATEDVDVLITREGLEGFKRQWLGRGYVELRPGGKGVRDATHGVKIDFLIAGDFPGDGKPKPVAFPDPADVAVELDGIKLVNLPTLVQLKLASGISGKGRAKDFGDVQELIKELKLPRDFADQLDPYVRSKYFELWDDAEGVDERESEPPS
jgi:hypothetical protein